MSTVASMTSSTTEGGHLRALDGWRGVSILCVLATSSSARSSLSDNIVRFETPPKNGYG